MRITAEDCGEKVMCHYLAHKISGDIPPSVIEIISYSQLKKLMRLGIVRCMTTKERQFVFALVKSRGIINKSLFDIIAGKEINCSIVNGTIYIQVDVNGRVIECSIPWFVVNALVFDD